VIIKALRNSVKVRGSQIEKMKEGLSYAGWGSKASLRAEIWTLDLPNTNEEYQTPGFDVRTEVSA
jgi:hypothetical protein